MATKNPYQYLCAKAIDSLTPRASEVILRRFGLQGREAETLEAIGKDFGVTRERVRQIEAIGLAKARGILESQENILLGVVRRWNTYLKSFGGVKREPAFLREVAGTPNDAPRVNFLLALHKPFERVGETEETHAAIALEKGFFEAARNVILSFQDFFERKQKTFTDKEMWDLYQKRFFRSSGDALSKQAFFSYIDLSKEIIKGISGTWGMRQWSEINPRGLRDLAYVVYKKEGKPLHFMEVARLINAYGLRPGKKALHQSVHNDLIRDKRFVLVGRGMYALRDWGYEAGMVRDVIARILELAEEPLPAQEIVRRVLAQRQVKDTTVMLNLQNREFFAKTDDGLYMLKPKVA